MTLSSSKRSLLTVLLLATAVTLTWQPSTARDREDDSDFIANTRSLSQHNPDGTINSDQLLELGTPTVDSLKLTGEQCERTGNLDKAIMNFQRAVEMEPKNVETRAQYAIALEKKLRNQSNRDPKLFNFVVKQWVFVLKKADFVDERELASSHLNDLTGSSPTRMERAKSYLSRVLMPEDGSRAVAFGKRIKSETE